MKSSKEEHFLRCLAKAIKEIGYDISCDKYSSISKDRGFPSYSSITRQFGSWIEAKKLALLEMNNLEIVTNEQKDPLEELILSSVNKDSTLLDLCNRIDRSPETVKKVINNLVDRGYNLEIKEDERVEIKKEPSPFKRVNIESFYGGNVKIGVLGDTQLGSNYERLDVLHALYDLYEKEGITKVFHAGDLIDGEQIYSGHEYEVKVVGADKQIQHTIENYPKKENIVTYFISGNHDLVYYKRMGYDIGRGFLTQTRSDMKYLGPEEADFDLYAGDVNKRKIPVKFRLFHPGGTGSAYAISYRSQKIIESYGGGEKPGILAIGHLHKASYFFVRNVHAIQVGCCQSQTRFMRNRAIQAHIGGFILEFNIDENGTITRFKNEFIPFYGG